MYRIINLRKDFRLRLKSRTKVVAPILALFLVLTISSVTLPFQPLNAQNITVKVQNATNSDHVSGSVISTLAKPGFGNKYDVALKGNTVPINYNVIGGTLVGMLADPAKHSLDLAVSPGPNGGAVEIELPRHTIDSKNAAGNDMPFVVKMDGSRVSGEPTGVCIGNCPNIFNSFKETQNTNTDRVLTIVFGPESRFVEIIGNTGV